ncbi:hypothetical protein HMPREF1421_01673, partial [Helicobacter pylori GAM265BSii]
CLFLWCVKAWAVWVASYRGRCFVVGLAVFCGGFSGVFLIIFLIICFLGI